VPGVNKQPRWPPAKETRPGPAVPPLAKPPLTSRYRESDNGCYDGRCGRGWPNVCARAAARLADIADFM